MHWPHQMNCSELIVNCRCLMQSVSEPHFSANFSDNQSIVREHTSLEITCSVSYVGNLLPVFRCQPSAAQKLLQFNRTQFDSHKLGETVVTMFVHVYRHVIDVGRELDGTPLTCTMKFTHNNISDVESPAYNFTWNSNRLVVECQFITKTSSAGCSTHQWPSEGPSLYSQYHLTPSKLRKMLMCNPSQSISRVLKFLVWSWSQPTLVTRTHMEKWRSRCTLGAPGGINYKYLYSSHCLQDYREIPTIKPMFLYRGTQVDQCQ